MPIRVLTVDDSPFYQEVLGKILASVPDILLAGRAFDGRDAVEKVLTLCPDVVTLDVEMPVMDGLEALKRIMKVRPTPVIMVSSHTRAASEATMAALQLGACDFVSKPDRSVENGLAVLHDELLVKVLALGDASRAFRGEKHAQGARIRPLRGIRVVAIGASTGGTTVVTRILEALPPIPSATILVVQHLPLLYSQEFARRLAKTVRCPVSLAGDGDLMEPGRVFIAPGGSHLTVYANRLRIGGGEPVNGHKPSVDVTLASVAAGYGAGVCAVILTGIGRDGARGIEMVKAAGGATMAQDEATSVVFGMPKAAIATGCVDCVLPDQEICAQIAGAMGGK